VNRPRPVPCDVQTCQRRFKNKASVLQHLEARHGIFMPRSGRSGQDRVRQRSEADQRSEPSTSIVREVPCEFPGCSRRFDDRYRMKQHFERDHIWETKQAVELDKAISPREQMYEESLRVEELVMRRDFEPARRFLGSWMRNLDPESEVGEEARLVGRLLRRLEQRMSETSLPDLLFFLERFRNTLGLSRRTVQDIVDPMGSDYQKDLYS